MKQVPEWFVPHQGSLVEPVVGIFTLKGVFVLKSVYVEPGKPARLVDVDFHTIQEQLGFISCAYPFPDPSVAVICDDDGIANNRAPNRTINGELMPGPFYILTTTSSGELTGLSDAQAEHYLELFSIPESFPAGRWSIKTTVEDLPHTSVIHIKSSWIPVCPRCGNEYSDPPALSRADNATLICPDCGMREALEAVHFSPDRIEAIIKEARK